MRFAKPPPEMPIIPFNAPRAKSVHMVVVQRVVTVLITVLLALVATKVSICPISTI